MAVIKNFGYFLSESFRSTRHSWVMSLASVSIVTISLLLLGIFMLMARNLDIFAASLEKQMEVTAYLADGMTEETAVELQNQVTEWKEVSGVTYVSKEEAKLRLQEELKEDGDILEIVGENPLPALYEVQVRNAHDIEPVVGRLKRIIWVEDVSYGQKLVNRLLALTKIIRYFGWGMVGLLALASLMIIANTIKLTVYARRDEIEIMKLVGATDWFIRWPFLIEGMLQGCIGAVLAILILYGGYEFLIEKAEILLPFLSHQFDISLVWRLSVKLILFGAFLGIIGSFFSVRRFLKN